jgi:hypothetical protein
MARRFEATCVEKLNIEENKRGVAANGKLLFRPPKFAFRPLVVTKMPLKKHFVA